MRRSSGPRIQRRTRADARALLPLGEEDEQLVFCKRIQTEHLSVRATEKLVNETIRQADDDSIHVIDEGPGLPTSIQDNLFSPCQSSKENGSGIGLAISYQLAKHIDAEIILHKTGPDGTCFIVNIAISTAAEENKKNIS